MNSTSDSEPATELEVELRVLAGRDALALDARLHPADLAAPLFGERFAVHVLLGALEERSAELGVARDDASRA